MQESLHFNIVISLSIHLGKGISRSLGVLGKFHPFSQEAQQQSQRHIYTSRHCLCGISICDVATPVFIYSVDFTAKWWYHGIFDDYINMA